MGASVRNMHINFRFHVSCRWKQAYCLRLKSPSCIDFSEWNMTISYSQMLSSRSSKLLSLLSWEKVHWGEELQMSWGKNNYSRHELQCIWLKKRICSEVQDFFSLKAKQSHPSPPSSSHSIHHTCTCNSTMWPASDNNPVIDSTTYLCSLPHSKKVSVPTTGRYSFISSLPSLPKTAMGLSAPTPSASVQGGSEQLTQRIPSAGFYLSREELRQQGCPQAGCHTSKHLAE